MLDADQKVSKAKIFFELDQMRGRFANIYAIPNFLKIEFQVVKLLESALRSSNHSITDNIGLVQDLNNIARLILMILNNESEIELIKLGLLPLPKQFAFWFASWFFGFFLFFDFVFFVTKSDWLKKNCIQ